MTVDYGGGKGRTDANTMIMRETTKQTSARIMKRMITIWKNMKEMGFDV